MEKAAAKPPLPHDLILESRSRLTVTGVQKVLHCSAESAALETGKGILHLYGAQISMQTLDLEAGEAKLTGRFPRDFAFLPGERFVVVGHKMSDEIQVYRFDRDAYALTPVVAPIPCWRPLCFAFARTPADAANLNR